MNTQLRQARDKHSSHGYLTPASMQAHTCIHGGWHCPRRRPIRWHVARCSRRVGEEWAPKRWCRGKSRCPGRGRIGYTDRQGTRKVRKVHLGAHECAWCAPGACVSCSYHVILMGKW